MTAHDAPSSAQPVDNPLQVLDVSDPDADQSLYCHKTSFGALP
jgi:hypothetical protein